MIFSVLVLPSIAFARSPDHAFDRAFESAVHSAVDRGATLSPSLKERDKESAKRSFPNRGEALRKQWLRPLERGTNRR